MNPVVIIGAGLSGLSAAHALHRAGYRVQVLEKSPQVGGVIQTLHEDGYQAETGPNSYTSTGAAINALVQDLGLTPVAVDRRIAKKRYLVHHHHLTPLPDNPLALLTTPLLSPSGKLRVLGEPWRKPLNEAEPTLAAFLRNRLGPEMLDRFAEPFVSGVYAGNPEELSAPAVFPQLYRWEQGSGSLLRGALAARKAARQNGQARPPYRLLSFAEGMAALPHALANALPEGSIRLSAEVRQIVHSDAQTYQVQLGDGQILTAQAVILATPAATTAELLPESPLSPAAQQALRDIPYAAMNVLHTGFERTAIPHPLDGFGFLIPRTEGLPLLGSIWASSLFPGRAPAGHVLFSNFIGGAHAPEMADWTSEAIEAQVRADLATVFHQPDLRPSWTRLIRWRHAIPQYTLGHRTRIATLEAALQKHPSLAVCGNYLQGVSLNDCVVSGQQAAQAVLSFLSGAPS